MKRFTDTSKWAKPWFRKSSNLQKLLWLYVCDNCDWAGFLEIDVERIAFDLNIQADSKDLVRTLSAALEGLKDVVIRDGWLWISDFVQFQQPQGLNPRNNAHAPIISSFRKQSKRFPEVIDLLGPDEDLLRSPSNCNGNGKGNGSSKMGECEGVEKRRKKPVHVEYPDDFSEWWKVYNHGVKKEAFDEWGPAMKVWQAQGHDQAFIIDRTMEYIAFCHNSERSMKDGCRWLKHRLWDQDWKSMPSSRPRQGTKPKEPDYTKMLENANVPD